MRYKFSVKSPDLVINMQLYAVVRELPDFRSVNTLFFGFQLFIDNNGSITEKERRFSPQESFGYDCHDIR